MQYPDKPGDHPPADASQPLPPYGTYQVPRSNQPSQRRPGTVSGAAILTIVMSSISIVCGLIAVIASAPMADYIADHPRDFDVRPQDVENPANIMFGLIAFSALLIIFAITAIVFAAFVMKRQQWARVILTVLTAVTILFGAIGSVALVGAPWFISGIIVVVLLYTGGANSWFAPENTRDTGY